MTYDEILDLQAGRDLDVLIHRLVMGGQCERFYPQPGEFGSDLDDWYCTPLVVSSIPRPVPHYSTNIAAAWEVVERLEFVSLNRGCSARYLAQFWGRKGDVCATGETAPLAICRAALHVVEANQ